MLLNTLVARKSSVELTGYTLLMKITPVLVVDKIEPSIEFWVDRMGFDKIVEMPEGDKLGFVILTRSGFELMFQTAASVAKDIPQFAPKTPNAPASIYIEVDDFGDTLKRLNGYPVVMPERVTFYGMREIGLFEPGGHIAIFAARE